MKITPIEIHIHTPQTTGRIGMGIKLFGFTLFLISFMNVYRSWHFAVGPFFKRFNVVEQDAFGDAISRRSRPLWRGVRITYAH